MKTLQFTRLLAVSFTILAGAAVAAEYEPGSGWREISFNVGNNAVFNNEEPFTFTARAELRPVLRVVTFCGTARFRIFNFGVDTGLRTQSDIAEIHLPPGDYSLTFEMGAWSVHCAPVARAQFEVDILPAPVKLQVWPKQHAAYIGGDVTFSVQAEGALPLYYQWVFNGTNFLAGETNAQLSLTTLRTDQTGFYSAIVSNHFGQATSPAASLRVFDALVGVQLYAGLNITGIVGRTYFVDYITNIMGTNWNAYVTNTLTSSNWLFIDTNTPVDPKKFFRVRLHPE